MIRNYLKIALRNLLRQKFYSLINLLGLSIGIACALLLFLYIRHEMSYDAHFRQADKIYRLEYEKVGEAGKAERSVSTPWRLAAAIKKDYPEVAAATKTMLMPRLLFSYQKKHLMVSETRLADKHYFQVFSHRFLQGDPAKALQKPKSIVLTKSLARKVLGSFAGAVGTTLIIEDEPYSVTGIIEDIPENTHFKVSAFLSMTSMSERRKRSLNLNSWVTLNFATYIRLKNKDSEVNLEKKFTKFTQTYINPVAQKYNAKAKLKVVALRNIRLYSSDLVDEGITNGSIVYVYLFSAITFLILLIAGINYMNLATARSINRAKEVGIRKVVGSYRSQLITQFLIESFLLVSIATIVGLTLAELAMPFFNQVADKSLSTTHLLNPTDIFYCVLILLTIGLVSGSYPAFVLSAFKPALVLKGKFGSSNKNTGLRKTLVVVQFSISIVLIITTWFVYKQINFMLNKEVGYQRDELVVMSVPNDKMKKSLAVVKNKLKQHPQIKAVTSASFIPVVAGHWAKNSYVFETKEKPQRMSALFAPVDENYLQTIGITLLAGKNFDRKVAQKQGVIVNETLVKALGWQVNHQDPALNPLGKRVATGTTKNGNPRYSRKIIGVVKDFHSKSFHEKIEPMVLTHNAKGWAVIARLNTQKLKSTLKYMQGIWQSFDSERPFEARFINKAFDSQYKAEERIGNIFVAFSLLAIFIACLGLFGLVSFVVRQRNKEIGIRKVLGASVSHILQLISYDFVKLILIANVLAFPLAYFVVVQWLRNFAYQTSLNLLVFILSGIIALAIALFTISVQAIKATTINPAEVLKDE